VKRPTILLDCDGPMALFAEAYLDAYRKETGERRTVDEIDRWEISECPWFIERARAMGFTHAMRLFVERRVTERDFCSLITPRTEAIEAVAELRQIADVYVVTSPWTSSPTWVYERTRWIERHFGIPPKNVIHTAAKHLVHGDLLLDDKPSHVESWGERWPDGFALLYGMPHNRDAEGLTRVDWDDVITVARALVAARCEAAE